MEERIQEAVKDKASTSRRRIHLEGLIEHHSIQRRRPKTINNGNEGKQIVMHDTAYTHYIIGNKKDYKFAEMLFSAYIRWHKKGEIPKEKWGQNKKSHAIWQEVYTMIRDQINKYPVNWMQD